MFLLYFFLLVQPNTQTKPLTLPRFSFANTKIVRSGVLFTLVGDL